ncbi:glycoside hydrolase family 78 protein [Planoprotostelium fungivorum]|uniref:Glycoside hydrolase family 78 protein n=1 Tax=Planoprotostelium fungivorum TaxID=1890364 RepID=A0A2P6N231_9EUKA|nr:glycoside hydrolase family 78 protein [Planoprotostelium fungivorum]
MRGHSVSVVTDSACDPVKITNNNPSMRHSILFLLLLSLYSCSAKAPSGPWDNYNLAPAQRSILPQSVYETGGDVVGAVKVLQGGQVTLSGDAWVVLDFGKESPTHSLYKVGGIVSFHFGSVATSAALSMSYTESPYFVSRDNSDTSKGGNGEDGVWSVKPQPSSFYTVPSVRQRGGFRYLTLSISSGQLSLYNLTLYSTWSPHFSDLRGYSGYFHSSDDLLNRIWYSGAYTVQLCSVPGQTGRPWPPPAQGDNWKYDGDLGTDGPVLVDAPKRDRTAWLGDLGISLATAVYTTGDLVSSRNAIDSVFDRQQDNGMFNYCGPPWNLGPSSDTYHMWALVAYAAQYNYAGDLEWAKKNWKKYVKGLEMVVQRIDDTGLFLVVNTNDWMRPNTRGHHLGANVLFYRALRTGAAMATDFGDTALAARWNHIATSVRSKVNEKLWVEESGMYKDSDISDVLPQDGNSLAVIFEVATFTQKRSISAYLRSRWNTYGALNPECPGKMSPFITGFEVMAHYSAGHGKYAQDLIKLHWGYLLTAGWSTRSTFVEGILEDGTPNYSPFDFLSQSHGWSTGPTSALSQWALGLQVEKAGKMWQWLPTGDVQTVEGGLEVATGNFSVQITRQDALTMTAQLTVPLNTSGSVGLVGLYDVITVDGQSPQTSFVDGRTVFNLTEGGVYSIKTRRHVDSCAESVYPVTFSLRSDDDVTLSAFHPLVLSSPSCLYYLTVQLDGNVVVYNEQRKAVWQNSGKKGGVTVKMSVYGDVVEEDVNGERVWDNGSAYKGVGPFALQLGDTAELSVVDNRGKVIWTNA